MTNEQLVTRIRFGENEADNMLALWQQNQGMIRMIAKKYCGYEEFEDLLQEGYFGLCEAVQHYDITSDNSFITYAVFWIKHSMQRYVDNWSSVVRIPVHAKDKAREFLKISREYQEKFGFEPSDGELQRLLGVGAERLTQIKKNASAGQITSLNIPVGEDNDITLEDMIESEENLEDDVIRCIDRENMARDLWLAVDQLPEEQADIIRKIYKKGMSVCEVSEQSGVSYSAIRTMQDKALRFLRFPRRCRSFKGYYEEYLTAADIHHIGVEKFQRTWTSSVERDALHY